MPTLTYALHDEASRVDSAEATGVTAPEPPSGFWARARLAYRTRRAVRWPVDLLALGLLVLSVGVFQTRGHARGVTAPAGAFRTIDGAEISLQALGGQPTVIAFWAPWCGVCKASSDNLSRLARWTQGRARVISVAVAYSDEAAVRTYVQANQVDYPVLLGDDALAQAMGVTSFPTLYFVGRDGLLHGSAVGYTTTLGLWLRLWWAA